MVGSKSSVPKFQPLIVIYGKGNFVYHHLFLGNSLIPLDPSLKYTLVPFKILEAIDEAQISSNPYPHKCIFLDKTNKKGAYFLGKEEGEFMHPTSNLFNHSFLVYN